jgi:hypothetical protein
MVQLKLDREIGDRTFRTGKLVFAAVLMSAVLSACGGDSDSAPAASAAPTLPGTGSAGLVATPSTPGTSGATTLSWTPPTSNDDGTPLTLTGYKIYWGLTEGNYSNSVTLDNPGLSRYVIEQLTPATWFFVATALSADGESPPSNVVRMQIN